MDPLIQYVETADGVSIAYRRFGSGPALVILPPLPLTHLQAEWEIPVWRAWLESVAERHTVIRYDSRGTGLSERHVADWSLDAHLLDLESVVARAAEGPVGIAALSYSGPVGIAFAARFSSVVARLVLWCTHACMADVYARLPASHIEQEKAIAGLASVDFDLYIRTYLYRAVGWGEATYANQFVTLARQSIDPGQFTAALQSYTGFDARDQLAEVAAPTLVLHRPRFLSSHVDVARGLAARIPNAQLVLLDGDSVAPFVGDSETPLRLMDEFLGASIAPPSQTPAAQLQGLRTLLFTDIEGHTAMMQRRGDADGRTLLRFHEETTRSALRRFGGEEVKSMGDGFLASFTSTQRAIECAVSLQRALAAPDPATGESVKVRVGLNAGEPIAEDNDLFGTAVIAAARIATMASGGEILVSRVVRELAAGKGFVFEDRGEQTLRGFDEPVRIYELKWQPA